MYIIPEAESVGVRTFNTNLLPAEIHEDENLGFEFALHDT